MDESNTSYIRSIVEAVLFTTEKPVMLDQIKDIIDGAQTAEIRDVIETMKKEFSQQKRGFLIVEIAGGYQILTNPDFAMYVKKFYRTKHKEKLSKPALETLAIIAYKQPVSRLDIELIRGVNSDGVVVHLLSKELIKIAGRKDVPGRPYLYGTTRQFLEYFGLKSLEDLPKLEDFSSLQELPENVDGQSQQQEASAGQGSPQNNDAQKETQETKNESGETAQKN